MAININADTTNGLVITSDNSGEITLQNAGVTKATINSNGITSEDLILTADNDSSLGVARNKLLFHDTDTAVATGQSAGAIEWEQDGGTLGAGTIGRLECIAEGTGGSYAMRFYTGNATNIGERVRILSGGAMCIGTTASIHSNAILNAKMTQSSGTVIATERTLSTTARHMVFYNPNGEVGSIQTNGSTTSYVTSSDHRLKENNVNITDGITRVKLLKPYRFNFIADADTTVDGFYAHEVQSVVPEAIIGTHNEVDDDGNPVYQGMDQSKLVPLLTAALKEAITKIEDLESRIQTLENN